MRILLVTEFFPTTRLGDFTGGVETRTFFVAKELAKRHEVTILCSRTEGSKRYEKVLGFTIIRVGPIRQYSRSVDPMRIFYILAAVWKGTQLDIDLVEGTNFVNQFIAYQIGRIKKIPIVFWTPDVWRGQWVKNMGIIGGMTGAVLERYNLSHRSVHFIAISSPVARKLEQVGIPRNLIKVIPCGVDFRWFNSIKQKRSSKPILCTISNLIKYKSLDVFIQAAALVIMQEPHVEVQIVGQGPEYEKLKKLAQKLGIVKQVKFLGFIRRYDDVIRILKSATVFCFSSLTEGFGIVIAEAMAAGVPYVISDTPVNRSSFQKRGGFFFTPGDHNDMAKSILRLLSNSSLYTKLRKEGQEFSKKYDWRFIAKQTEKLYESVYRH